MILFNENVRSPWICDMSDMAFSPEGVIWVFIFFNSYDYMSEAQIFTHS